jgi:hypothetical protein
MPNYCPPYAMMRHTIMSETIPETPADSPPKRTPAVTKRQRMIAVLVGVALIIFALWGASTILLTGGGIPLVPQDLTLIEANEVASENNTYVNLQDAVVLCDTLEYRTGRSSSTNTIETRYTFVWMVDTDREVGVFAQYSGRTTCEAIQEGGISGYLTRAVDTLPREASPLPLGRGADYMELCTYCGPLNSLGMVALFAVMVLAGIFAIYRGLTLPIIEAHPKA